MNIERFEDIIAWQKARQLTLFVYQDFQSVKDYGFRDQIQRASVSVMNNIAEGFERKGDKEFSKFLYIAKGSCCEIRSMLYLAKDLKYLSEDQFKKLFILSEEIARILSGFISSIN